MTHYILLNCTLRMVHYMVYKLYLSKAVRNVLLWLVIHCLSCGFAFHNLPFPLGYKFFEGIDDFYPLHFISPMLSTVLAYNTRFVGLDDKSVEQNAISE